MSEGDEPAFPFEFDKRHSDGDMMGHEGMTLRDYFAGQALADLGTFIETTGLGKETWDEESMADYAYRIADAMLDERGGE